MVIVLAVGAVSAIGSAAGQSVATSDVLSQQETPDETPIDETPTDDEADGEGQLAGVPEAAVENGSLNLTALYGIHSDVLRSEGYRTTENVTVEMNGTISHTMNVSETATGANRSLSVTNATMLGRTSQISVWTDDDERFVRMERAGNVTYREMPTRDRPMPGYGPQLGSNDTAQPPGPMAPAGHGPMAGHDVPGRVLVALENATGEFTVAEEPLAEADTEPETVTLTAPIEMERGRYDASGNVTLAVDDRGVVRAVNATVEAPSRDATMSYRLAVEEVGVTTVDEPDWLSEARDEARTPAGPGMGPGPGPGPGWPGTDRGPGQGPGPGGPGTDRGPGPGPGPGGP